MNTERLHSLTLHLIEANEKHNFANLLQNVENTYIQAAQSPSPENASAFDAAKDALRNAAVEFPLGNLSSSRRKLLKSIGGLDYYGDNLVRRVDDIIASAETPSNAIAEIQQLRSGMQVFFPAVQALNENIDKLGVAVEDIPDDSAEIEVLIPRTMVDGYLDEFAKEISRLNRAFLDIQEVVTGERTHLDIRSLGSGSLELYLTVDLNTGAVLLQFMTAVVLLINSILQIRRGRDSFKQLEAPKQILKDIKGWEDEIIKKKIDELRNEILEHYKGGEERKNELSNALSKSLDHLADRIDRGMDIDVTTAATVDEKGGDETGEVEQIQARRRSIESIRENTNVINQLERSQEPVLQLPVTEEDL